MISLDFTDTFKQASKKPVIEILPYWSELSNANIDPQFWYCHVNSEGGMNNSGRAPNINMASRNDAANFILSGYKRNKEAPTRGKTFM